MSKSRVVRKKLRGQYFRTLQEAGYRIEGLKFSEDNARMSFRIRGFSDFLWGLWIYGKEIHYFGTFECCIDKFKPTAVDYDFEDAEGFIKFLETFKRDYQRRVLELLPENSDYSGPTENLTWEVWKEYQRKQQFYYSHFNMTEEEWAEAWKEKEGIEEKLKSNPWVLSYVFQPQTILTQGLRVLWKIGSFVVLEKSDTPVEEQDKIWELLWSSKYTGIARPLIYKPASGDYTDEDCIKQFLKTKVS